MWKLSRSLNSLNSHRRTKLFSTVKNRKVCNKIFRELVSHHIVPTWQRERHYAESRIPSALQADEDGRWLMAKMRFMCYVNERVQRRLTTYCSLQSGFAGREASLCTHEVQITRQFHQKERILRAPSIIPLRLKLGLI